MQTKANGDGYFPNLSMTIALVLVVLVAAASLWGPGMVNTRGGGDSPFLLQRTQQMVANLRAGVFPVRWMPDAAYGLGYPFFSFYAALPYYLAGLLVLAGLDLLTALKLVQTLGFVAAALAMYGWAHRLTRNHGTRIAEHESRKWAAWLAAAAYTVAPFHLVNVYVRGDSLSEFWAFVFYPLILWGLDHIGPLPRPLPSQWRGAAGANQQISKSTIRNLVWPALAYAGLILTHNISALIFSPFALLYLVALALRDQGRRWRVLGYGLLSLGLGLFLAAWYWLPALAETRLVQLGPSTQDYFHYSRHFRALNLVQGGLLFDYATTADPGGRSPFAMGLPQAIFATLGMLVLLVQGLRRRLEVRWGFVVAGLLISTAMITPLSRLLWDHLPLLPIVQFPWRFLSVQALFTAAATAAPVAHLSPGQDERKERWVTLGSAALLVLSVILPLRPERLFVGPADVTTERLQLYELFTGNIGTTIRYEWLPATVIPRPFTSDALIEPGAPPRAIPLDGASLEADLVERKPTRQVWRVRGEGSVAFPLLYWPGWAAQVDGEPVQAHPVEGSGYLAVEVPPGEHTVVLWLGRTPVRAVAEEISLVAVLGLVALMGKSQIRNPKPQASRWGVRQRLLGLGVWILGLALLVLFLPSQELQGENDLTMDFDQMPYLHHNPNGVDFGQARLMGYRLSAEELDPGEALTVALDWTEVISTCTATVRLVSPAAVRYDVEPLAEAISDLQSPISDTVTLQIPDDIPRGLYLLQLHLSGPEGELHARTPGGRTRGTLYLRPVRIRYGPARPTRAPVLAAFGPAVRLHRATIAPLTPGRLAVQLDWSAQRALAANYCLSLRLQDAAGQTRVALDTQPGYGFLPTSLWRPGELVSDRYVLALPDDLPPGDGYQVEVVLYQGPTLAAVGQARLGGFALPLEVPFEAQPLPRQFVLPDLENPLGVDFSQELRLAGYAWEKGATGHNSVTLTLWWQALQAPQADYTVFVHLFDPATEAIVAQSDAMPHGGTYPTSWWATGEVVSETVTLPLAGVPEGTYSLAVGLYDQTLTRLVATGPDGQRLPNGRVILPVSLEME